MAVPRRRLALLARRPRAHVLAAPAATPDRRCAPVARVQPPHSLATTLLPRYSVVPLHLRVLWVDVLEVVWVAILSTAVASSKPAQEAAAQGGGDVCTDLDGLSKLGCEAKQAIERPSPCDFSGCELPEPDDAPAAHAEEAEARDAMSGRVVPTAATGAAAPPQVAQ